MQGTFGGIKINTNTEALKEDGTVPKGLYSAGECAGGTGCTELTQSRQISYLANLPGKMQQAML